MTEPVVLCGNYFASTVNSHSRSRITPCPFPFPWESRGRNGNAEFPFPDAHLCNQQRSHMFVGCNWKQINAENTSHAQCYLLDFVAKYEEVSTTALSPNQAVAVPLLTISSWILMQRKVNGGSVSFQQNWAEYRDGFGAAPGNDNYWLGLDKVYRLVQQGSTRLRVEVQ